MLWQCVCRCVCQPDNTTLKDYGRLLKDGELKIRAHSDNRTKTRYEQRVLLPMSADNNTHTYTRLTALCPGLPRYQKGKTNLDITEARDSEWQWHQLGHMQICTSLQTNNRASIPPLSFVQARCPSCRPTNSVKALQVHQLTTISG